MRLLCYDDAVPEELGVSLFLAGPTAPGGVRTPWRARALALLEEAGFPGTVVLPEFRSRRFAEAVDEVFGKRPGTVPGMRATSCGVLEWETAALAAVRAILFWMPFALGPEGDPSSLPGFTTRAEVARELERSPGRVVLGMPPGALSSGHIRFHAHQLGVPIHPTLETTVRAAASLAARAPGTGLRDRLPPPGAVEHVDVLLGRPGVRLERIVSDGQVSPPGFWYDQAEDEWVALLQGVATLEFADGSMRELHAGDALLVPAGQRHRVSRTGPRTIWLALFVPPVAGS